jgi:hypothetical protein
VPFLLTDPKSSATADSGASLSYKNTNDIQNARLVISICGYSDMIARQQYQGPILSYK